MTEIYITFDTEDFTSNYASDAIRDQAKLLTEHGVRASFNIVGYLARELVRYRRADVLDALKAHTISFHSLRHTYHPTINEYTDIEDYAAARKEFMRQEIEGMGMVKAATGVDSFPAAVPPGDSFSYVAMYAYADLGIPVYYGSFFNTPDGKGVFFCNGFHVNYDHAMEQIFLENGSYDKQAFIESLAGKKRVVLYNHPNKVLYKVFWDAVNYRGRNIREMHDWIEPERRSPEEVAFYYRSLADLVESLQADSRFEIRSLEDLVADAKRMEKRTVTRDMLPAIREKLTESFTWLSEPVSLSIADCFHAARHFLTSDEAYVPGKVYGFLSEPEGTNEVITLSQAEVMELAGKADPAAFLPPYYTINGKKIGPADLLFAMLDVCSGAEAVTVSPKAQECDHSRLPAFKSLSLRGKWMHSPDFEDRYLSDRARLQAWTIRTEE